MKKFAVIISLLIVTLLMSACARNAEMIEVTFDGNDCIVTGPTELPAGEHTTIFIDQTDLVAELYLLNLEEGKTTQDILDGQSEPGEWYLNPGWVFYDRRISTDSEESNGERVDTITWDLDKVGEHPIACYVPSPEKMWFVAHLWVVEAQSEQIA